MADMTPQEAGAAGVGWVDQNNPNYGKKGFVGYQDPSALGPGAGGPNPGGMTGDPYTSPLAPTSQPPTPPAAPTSTPPKDPTPQEAAAQGLGWVDRNNPNWGKPGFVGSTPAGGGVVTPPTDPIGDPQKLNPTDLLRPTDGGTAIGDPPTRHVTDGLASDALTPIQGAGSGGVTADAETGQQKLLRDALIAQMSQSKDVNATDPNIKAQLDPYAASQERARSEAVRRGAEGAFANNQDYGATEKMAEAEKAGEATGLKASDLVGREIQSKRDEIQKALTQFGGVMSEDQKNALERRAQDLDAQLKREGIGADVYKTNKSYDIEKYKTDRGFDMDKMRLDADTIIKQAGLKQTGDLGNRELDIRDKLGMAGMNAQMTQMLLQDKQFRQKLGLDAGIAEAGLNRDAMSSLLQG